MAWDDHKIGGVWLLSGDIPFDAMHAAVDGLNKAFLDRWGRPPYLAELLYPLLSVAARGPNPAVADEVLPSIEDLLKFVGGPTTADHIEPGDYEGASDGESDDFVIFPRKGDTTVPVVRGEAAEADGGYACRYDVLAPTLTDRTARVLIRACVLEALLGVDLSDRDLSIRFERRTR